MNRQYISKKNNYTFSTLKAQNNYNCSGSCCTCKNMNSKSRTLFDTQQFLKFKPTQSIIYNNINKI